MEQLLFLWDEVDDWAGAGRHWLVATAAEIAALAGPILSAGSALALWWFVPPGHVDAALLGISAAFRGTFGRRLRRGR
jgi:hypothetical protein